MVLDDANSSLTALDQQLIAISNCVQEIGESLHPGAAQPERISEASRRLAEALPRFRKQVSDLQADWRSLRALTQIGQVVNSSLDLDVVLQIVMDTIIKLTGAERGFLMLRGEDGELRIRLARNWEQESLNASELTVSRTIIQRVVSDGQPLLTTNAQEDPRFHGQQSIVAYSLRSILCVPMRVKNELIGVIYADNRIRSGIFTTRDLELLAGFANHAAVAIENARLFASVRRTLTEVTELKNLMDNVFASIASGVLTTDLEERILLCNRAAGQILGRSAAEMLGQDLQNVLPAGGEALSTSLKRALASDPSPQRLEINPVLPARGEVDLQLSLTPLKDARQATQGVAIVMDDLTEKKRLEAQRRLFERMVSPAVIDQLDPDSLHLGGKRTEITILFADIRGSTAFGEGVPPEELFLALNRYLAAAAEAVLGEEGTVDKFMGDAVMAWFNAPIPQPDHTLRAVRAALAIQAAARRLQTDLPPAWHLQFGVGIHTGEALLGLIGTEKRLEYTAIGDSVNTARRIQEHAAAGQILITQAAFGRIAGLVRARPVEAVLAKGKREPVAVYALEGLVQNGASE